MAGPTFDPNGAVRFDLKGGSASDARGARLVLVPAEALDALDPDVLERLGADIGHACGARAAARLGGDAGVRAAQLESVVSHIAGELSVAGIGAMHIERWGRALVVIVQNPSVSSDVFVAAVLAGAIGAASGRQLAGAALGRDAGLARFFLGSAETAENVRGLVAQGYGYAEIVASLQGAQS